MDFGTVFTNLDIMIVQEPLPGYKRLNQLRHMCVVCVSLIFVVFCRQIYIVSMIVNDMKV